ncbi:hypothetical protein LNP17_25130 [Klebsiella variicola subsp. variicola]|nr:hypothetical protein [Klebsiella variicola subsp. variicola]
MTPLDEVRVQASQPSAGSLGTARPTIETGGSKVLASCGKTGGVKSLKKSNLLLFARESMQQWRAFRGYFYFQLNNKNCKSAVLIFQQISHHAKYRIAKKNLKNHAQKCKYGTASAR